MSQSETRRQKRRAERLRAARKFPITRKVGNHMGAQGDCFPIYERLLWLALIAAAAYFAANRGACSNPDACPCAPAVEAAPAPTPARPTDPPAAESIPQKAIVGRRRDGNWVRLEIKDGLVEETVISQGVLRPGERSPLGDPSP
jgi:hypothetical protein